jgi:membrane protein insertase Oxa1/YidC/SpoIIIJ
MNITCRHLHLLGRAALTHRVAAAVPLQSIGARDPHRRSLTSQAANVYDPEKPYPIWFFDPDGAAYQTALGVARTFSGILEHLHHFTGLPWWGTIALGSLLIRVVFFPVNCYALRNASRFFDAKPDIQALQRSHRAAVAALVLFAFRFPLTTFCRRP